MAKKKKEEEIALQEDTSTEVRISLSAYLSIKPFKKAERLRFTAIFKNLSQTPKTIEEWDIIVK